jgi:hypothetical protein
MSSSAVALSFVFRFGPAPKPAPPTIIIDTPTGKRPLSLKNASLVPEISRLTFRKQWLEQTSTALVHTINSSLAFSETTPYDYREAVLGTALRLVLSSTNVENTEEAKQWTETDLDSVVRQEIATFDKKLTRLMQTAGQWTVGNEDLSLSNAVELLTFLEFVAEDIWPQLGFGRVKKSAAMLVLRRLFDTTELRSSSSSKGTEGKESADVEPPAGTTGDRAGLLQFIDNTASSVVDSMIGLATGSVDIGKEHKEMTAEEILEKEEVRKEEVQEMKIGDLAVWKKDANVQRLYGIAQVWSTSKGGLTMSNLTEFVTTLLRSLQTLVSEPQNGTSKKKILLTVLELVVENELTHLSDSDRNALLNTIHMLVPKLVDTFVGLASGAIDIRKLWNKYFGKCCGCLPKSGPGRQTDAAPAL